MYSRGWREKKRGGRGRSLEPRSERYVVAVEMSSAKRGPLLATWARSMSSAVHQRGADCKGDGQRKYAQVNRYRGKPRRGGGGG
jgi:hypothetical protein